MDLRREARLLGAMCLILSAAAPVCGEQSPQWLPDYAEAVALARSQSKLLLVVDVSGDFTATAADSAPARLFQSLVIADPAASTLLAERFVCTFRAVGPSANVRCLPALVEVAKPKPNKRAPAPAAAAAPKPLPIAPRPESPRDGDFAVAYVCLPNLRVLHFLAGFGDGGALGRELKWAVAANDERLQAPPSDAAWLVRERHLTAVTTQELKLFEGRFLSHWSPDRTFPTTQDASDLSAAIGAAEAVRQQSLLARLKANWPTDADHETLLAALAAHGGLEPALAHLVLAEFPLPPLADLSQPLYETTSGQRFWQPSDRRDELTTWWRETRRSGAISLLVVADDRFHARGVTAAEPLRWPPTHGDVRRNLAHFAAEQVTLDEFAQLVADAELDPNRFQAGQGPVRYLIHDARGFRLLELSAREGTTKRLAQELDALVKSGAVAVKTRALGGTENERK